MVWQKGDMVQSAPPPNTTKQHFASGTIRPMWIMNSMQDEQTISFALIYLPIWNLNFSTILSTQLSEISQMRVFIEKYEMKKVQHDERGRKLDYEGESNIN